VINLCYFILIQFLSSCCTGHCVHVLQGHIGVVRCVHLVGDRLISAGDCKKVMIWNTKVNIARTYFSNATRRISLEQAVQPWNFAVKHCNKIISLVVTTY